MSKKITPAEVTEARADLLKLLKPGQIIHPVLRHRSASGMSRVIDLLIAYDHFDSIYPPKPADVAAYPGEKDFTAKPKRVRTGPRVRSIGWIAAKAMGRNFDSDLQGIKIGGCGMDMGFALVYDLGATLWPKGTPKPHGKRNGEPDSEGGYALKHSWL